MTYILIILVHVGIWGKTDSNSITSVPGFKTEASCRAAGTASKQLVSGTKKELEFVCVKQD